MELSATYSPAFWGISLILITWFIQASIASVVKAAQKGAIPGKIDPNLSHSSFVFRSHRTFMNSIENVPLMLGTSFLAVLIGANPFWSGVLILTFAVSRIVHMVLYYVLSTEQNPSPRSYFFFIAWLANITLLALCLITLV